MSNARPLYALLLLSSLALAACGGSESAAADPDAGDGGSDSGPGDAAPGDSRGSDAADAPGDAPLGREPKDHRPAATTCAPSKGGSTCGGSFGGGACKSDADCTAGKNGHCDLAGGGAPRCACFYDTCASDSECTTGGPCACQGSPYQPYANDCAPAGSCKVDADCGPSGYCSPAGALGCSGGLAGYFCHAPTDECVDDEDCKGKSMPQACTYDKTKAHWACVEVLACA